MEERALRETEGPLVAVATEESEGHKVNRVVQVNQVLSDRLAAQELLAQEGSTAKRAHQEYKETLALWAQRVRRVPWVHRVHQVKLDHQALALWENPEKMVDKESQGKMDCQAETELKGLRVIPDRKEMTV